MQNIIKLKKKIERNFGHKLIYSGRCHGGDYYFGKFYLYKDMIFICEKCNCEVVLYQNHLKYTVKMAEYYSSYKKILSCAEVIIKSIIE